MTTGEARGTPASRSPSPADSTAPNASVLTFPAASGNYNNTAWNAGCATNGFCGTASDSQSGIASVAISIRQGTGNYWNGASFGSATEFMLNTTMAADDVSWSYTFAGASFPAEGNYTVRVVSTDNGANAETPGVSRTFKIDRTAPTSGVLALNSVTPAGSAYLSGTTVWYRGVQTGGGSFRLRNTVTDNVGGSGRGRQPDERARRDGDELDARALDRRNAGGRPLRLEHLQLAAEHHVLADRGRRRARPGDERSRHSPR